MEEYIYEPQVLSFDDLDVDRLHRVVTGEQWGRGCGTTLSYVVHMMHLIQQGPHNARFLYIGENYNIAINYTGRWLFDFATNEGFDIKRVRTTDLLISPNKQVFVFAGPNNLYHRHTNGMPYTDVFVDVTNETWYRYRRDIDLTLSRISQ